MALMLSMSRNVVPACNSLKSGAWDRKKYMGNQLNGKVLGVIGLGRIGMAVAKMAKGFNMKILGYDPLAAPTEAEKLGVEVTDGLERIFKEADYISVHVPKNKRTLNMIDAEQIKMMKPTVRLVNCARGGIINEDTLYNALAEKRIAGAALDVYPTEPPENTRFAEFENCLVTPHLGASTREAQIDVAVEAAQILVDAIKGGLVKNALNAPSTAGVVPPIVKQYAELARRIGTLVSTIAPGHIKNVEVQYRGLIAEMAVESVTLGFAVGLLQRHFDMPLNMVNVGVLAKERGISIDETKNTESKDVAASFSAKVVTDKVTRTVTGSVFGETLLRIIEIDGFNVEMTPQGAVLVIFNDDKPGVIGSVGTVCGRHNINICTMGVGQKLEEQKAALVVSLDKEPDTKAIAELSRLDFVNEIYVCKLD
jgi:D-3-phosphoglycerate dehydrogenase